MKNMRAFAVLTFATLLSACGEGLPETAELTDPQQEPGQEQEVPGDEQDVQTLTDYTFIAPQETRSFASLLFHRTAVYVTNTSDIPVQAHIFCSRYNYSRLPVIEPRQTWSGLATCEGTTIYVYNNAPFASSAMLHVRVEN